MRRGNLSPFLILALLATTIPARAEEFDLLAFLRPRPAEEPIAEDATAPIPPRRPVVSDVVLTPLPINGTAVAIAAQGVPQAAPLPASMPLPPRRPKIVLESNLLLLQLPVPARVAAAPVAVADAVAPAPEAVVSAPAERAPVPAPAVAVARAAEPGEPLVPPMAHAAIPLPMPRPVVTADDSDIKPTAVRTVKIAPPPPRPAPGAVASAPTATVPAASAPVAAAAPAAPVAVAPAPRPAVAAAAPAAPAPALGIRDLGTDPAPSTVSELPPAPRELPAPPAADMLRIAAAEAAIARTTPPAAPRSAKPAEDAAAGPTPPPDPSLVADAMLQRIPSVTSAIVGLVSAVSPSSAHASEGGAHGAEPSKSAAGAPAAPVPAPPPIPTNLTTVERKRGAPAPYELVRRLQRLQDLIAAGDMRALQAQRTLITEIETEFRVADPEVWQDPRNGRAAVIFFLSGGAPDELRNLLKLNPLPAVDERLLRGALAYVEGREEDAERYLGEINAMRLPDALGGQIALAQAAVTVRKDPQKAMAMLDVARLLMPGTLVEEAALRREILVAAQIGDVNQFEQLSRQYLFRFRYSVYAGNFRQRFAAALTRMAFANDPAQFPRLVALLAPLDRDSRVEIYLMVARGALNQGKLTAATLSAERVLAEAQPVSSDFERARVYRSAVRAASSKDVDLALTELRSAVRSRLPQDDVMLLDAAITTAELVKSAGETVKVAAAAPAKVDPMKLTVAAGSPALLPRVPVQETRVAAAAPPPPPPAAKPAEEAAVPSPLESRARGALDQVDAMLKDAPR